MSVGGGAVGEPPRSGTTALGPGMGLTRAAARFSYRKFWRVWVVIKADQRAEKNITTDGNPATAHAAELERPTLPPRYLANGYRLHNCGLVDRVFARNRRRVRLDWL